MRSAALVLAVAACGRVDFAPRADDGSRGDDGGIDATDGASGAAPDHLYRLAGNYDDDLGGPALVGHGGAFTAGGYAFGADQGLTLDGVLGSAYTLDLQFELDDIGNGWRKLVDYAGLTKDEGFYTYDRALQFVIASGADFETTRATLAATTPIRLTITRSAAGEVIAYMGRVSQPAMRNTAPDPPAATSPGSQFEFSDTTGVAAPGASIAFFIDDSGTGMSEASSGTARQIAIWDHPLTNSEIAALP